MVRSVVLVITVVGYRTQHLLVLEVTQLGDGGCGALAFQTDGQRTLV